MPKIFPEQSIILTSGERTIQVIRVQADTKRVRLDLCESPVDEGLQRVTFQVYPADTAETIKLILEWIGPVDPALLAWVGQGISEEYGDYRGA